MLNKLKQLGITRTTSGKCLCPKCSASRKNKHDPCLSITVKPDRILYHCHNPGCDFSGVVFAEDSTPKKVYKKPQALIPISGKEKMYKYIEGRGISRETVDKFKLEYVEHFFPQLNKKTTCVAFPYYRNGELINVKYRTGDKKFLQVKDAESIFFGMDLITDFSRLIITEGEWDTMALAEIGIEAVSVPNGAKDGSNEDNKLECIENCWNWLQKFDSYVICSDNDAAGKILENSLIRRLGKHKCKVVRFRQDKDDANEVLKRSRTELKEVIEDAQYVPVPGLNQFLDKYDDIVNYWNYGYEDGKSTGWKNIDEIFKIKTGRVMVVTGIPSHGKSFWVDNLLNNLSISYQWRHLKWDAESTIETIFQQYASFMTGKPFGGYNKITGEEIHNALDFYNDYIYTIDTSQYNTVEDIIEFTHYAVQRYGIKTLTIDNYVKLRKEFKTNETDWIADFLSRMSSLAKELNILIIIVAHPSKPGKDSQKIPDMYNISGSAHWYDLCDYGLTVFRETDNNGKKSSETTIKVHKVKSRELGDPGGGTAYLTWSRFRLVDNLTKDFKGFSGNDDEVIT